MKIARYLNFIAVAALLGSAVYAYSIKYETMRYAAEITKAQHDIQRERDGIGMARAEWARLSRPERVQALAAKHLDLQSVNVDQYVKAASLPEHTAKVDMIGRKLEALGLAEPTATPGGDQDSPASSATPSPKR